MRTTLTLEEDVAAWLNRLRKSRNVSLKSLINEALRRGLRQIEEPQRPRTRHTTRGVTLGRCLLGNVDDVGETLAIAEREAYR